MESNRVNDEGLWDVLRLRDIQPGKINYGELNLIDSRTTCTSG